MGFWALLTTICLNAAGLIWLRKYSVTPELGLMVLALGYVPMASGIIFFRQMPLAVSGESSGHWKWLTSWALGVVSIYTLFFMWPQFISVSQLIVAQSVTPLLAVFVSGDYFRANEKRKEPLVNLLPLVFLLWLAWTKNKNGSGELLSFTAVCISFFVVQSSMRRLSKLKRPLWVLPRFALLTFVLISVALSCFGVPLRFPPPDLLYAGLAVGLALILIQGGYLVGIAKTPPLFSALMISSSVPIALFFEWFLAGRQASYLESGLAVGYVLSVAGQTLWKKKVGSAADEKEKKVA